MKKIPLKMRLEPELEEVIRATATLGTRTITDITNDALKIGLEYQLKNKAYKIDDVLSSHLLNKLTNNK
jgi:hypothetical protein